VEARTLALHLPDELVFRPVNYSMQYIHLCTLQEIGLKNLSQCDIIQGIQRRTLGDLQTRIA